MSGSSDKRIVVFDLGGVIVRICRTWEEGCRAAGVEGRAGMERWEGSEAKQRRRELNRLHQCGKIPSGVFYEGVAGSAPGVYTADEIRRVHQAWILEEYAGVGGLIDELHAAEVATGVLSNTNEAHWSRLVPGAGEGAVYPTPGRMRHVHASHLLGLVKPEVEIYEEFERRCGYGGARGGSGRSQIVFFDDLIENVEAARGAGWEAHQVDHTGDTASQMRRVLRERGVLHAE